MVVNADQTLPVSIGDIEKYVAYSPAVHKAIGMGIAGMIGILQLNNQQQSSVFETHKPQFLCFFVFSLLYAVLRICEVTEMRHGPGLVSMLVGYTSHLFGGLATVVLIYVVSATFAMVLLSVWCLWFLVVAYKTFSEPMVYWIANLISVAPVAPLALDAVVVSV